MPGWKPEVTSTDPVGVCDADVQSASLCPLCPLHPRVQVPVFPVSALDPFPHGTSQRPRRTPGLPRGPCTPVPSQPSASDGSTAPGPGGGPYTRVPAFPPRGERPAHRTSRSKKSGFWTLKRVARGCLPARKQPSAQPSAGYSCYTGGDFLSARSPTSSRTLGTNVRLCLGRRLGHPFPDHDLQKEYTYVAASPPPPHSFCKDPSLL